MKSPPVRIIDIFPAGPNDRGTRSSMLGASAIVALTVITDYPLRRRDPLAPIRAEADAAVLLELVTYGLIGGLAILGVIKWRNTHLFARDRLWMIIALIMALALASVTYSVVPLLGTVRAMQMVIVGLLVVNAAVSGDWFRYYCLTLLTVIIISIGAGLFVRYPYASYRGGFNWLYVHPFVAGSYCAVGLIIAFAFMTSRPALEARGSRRTQYRWPFMTMLFAIALVATQTRSALIGAVLACAIIWVTSGPRNRRGAGMVFMTLVVLAAVLAAGPDIVEFVMRGQTVETIATMSNRSDLLQYAWILWSDSPWWGYGFAASRLVFLSEFDLGGGHNVLVEAGVNLGALGLMLYILAYALIIVRCAVEVRVNRGQTSSAALGLAIFIGVMGVTSGSFASEPQLESIIFVSLAGLVARVPQRSDGC